jgi:hypothetical protein
VARGAGRDPLSVRYDPAAGRFVTRIIAARGGWVSTTVAPPSERIAAWAMSKGIDPFRVRYTGRASGIENQHEAAFRRAVYWDIRVYLWARPPQTDSDGERARNPERVCAVIFRWRRRTAAGRVCEARAVPVDAASRWGERNNPYGP